MAIASIDGGAEVTGTMNCFANQVPTLTASWKPTNVKQLALHTRGGYALRDDGTVVSLGTNDQGERGNDDLPNSELAPRWPRVEGRWNRVVLGTRHHGRNGDGHDDDDDDNHDGTYGDHTPVQVKIDADTPLAAVTTIGGAHGHRCAATADEVYCWGNGRYGKLGRPNLPDSNAYATPVTPSIAGATSIAAGRRGTCALLPTGRITCFGQTLFSQDATQRTYDAFVAP